MQTTDNLGLKLYEGTDLFNPLVVENPNCETLDEVIKAISDQAVGSATELVTGTVHALTRGLDDTDRDVFIFTATSNFTAGDTFTLDGQQVSALTVAGTPLASGCYIIGSSVLVHKRDTLLTFYVSETTAKDAEKLGGELPSYYAADSDLDAVAADVRALATKVGTAVLTTQAPDLSGAVNELNAISAAVIALESTSFNKAITIPSGRKFVSVELQTSDANYDYTQAQTQYPITGFTNSNHVVRCSYNNGTYYWAGVRYVDSSTVNVTCSANNVGGAIILRFYN